MVDLDNIIVLESLYDGVIIDELDFELFLNVLLKSKLLKQLFSVGYFDSNLCFLTIRVCHQPWIYFGKCTLSDWIFRRDQEFVHFAILFFFKLLLNLIFEFLEQQVIHLR